MTMPTNLNTIMPNMKYPNSGNVDYVSYGHTGEIKIKQPKYLSRLYITKDATTFCLIYKKPNIWLRFWQYILLGWKWENI